MGKATLERDDCIEEAMYRASMQHQIRRTMVGGSCKDRREKERRKRGRNAECEHENYKLICQTLKPRTWVMSPRYWKLRDYSLMVT